MAKQLNRMPYFRLYFGDELGCVSRMTTSQRGIYFSLLLYYWEARSQGKFLPNNTNRLLTLCGIGATPDDLLIVLDEQFTLNGDHWEHDQLDAKFEKAVQVSETARSNRSKRKSTEVDLIPESREAVSSPTPNIQHQTSTTKHQNQNQNHNQPVGTPVENGANEAAKERTTVPPGGAHSPISTPVERQLSASHTEPGKSTSILDLGKKYAHPGKEPKAPKQPPAKHRCDDIPANEIGIYVVGSPNPRYFSEDFYALMKSEYPWADVKGIAKSWGSQSKLKPFEKPEDVTATIHHYAQEVQDKLSKQAAA
jgi:uncharacterized protein YdaU (DUF1376 family)